MVFKKNNNIKGFSLMELSILLVIIGLLLVPLILAYKAYISSLSLNNSLGAISRVTTAINGFVDLNGRYPVPASFIAVEGDPGYGTEGSVSPPSCSSGSWTTGAGMCISADGNVLIGAVPFAALGINPDDTLDFWSQRLVYAVTLAQTDALTYGVGGGRVFALAYDRSNPAAPAIVDVTNLVPPAVGTPVNHDMILLSLGADGRGAYTRDGVLAVACDTTLAEAQNCEFSHEFLLDAHPLVTTWGSRSLAANTDYYDDITKAQETVPTDTWRANQTVPDYVITSASRVGINNTDPQYRVHVTGNVQAGTDVRSDSLCDGAGADCFNPEMIAGTLTEMDCNKNAVPGSEPVLALGNSQVYCGLPVDSGGTPVTPGGTPYVFPASFGRINCLGTGQLMAGIDAAGDPICLTPPP